MIKEITFKEFANRTEWHAMRTLKVPYKAWDITHYNVKGDLFTEIWFGERKHYFVTDKEEMLIKLEMIQRYEEFKVLRREDILENI
jgi:hypothetical protein